MRQSFGEGLIRAPCGSQNENRWTRARPGRPKLYRKRNVRPESPRCQITQYAFWVTKALKKYGFDPKMLWAVAFLKTSADSQEKLNFTGLRRQQAIYFAPLTNWNRKHPTSLAEKTKSQENIRIARMSWGSANQYWTYRNTFKGCPGKFCYRLTIGFQIHCLDGTKTTKKQTKTAALIMYG